MSSSDFANLNYVNMNDTLERLDVFLDKMI